MHEHNFCFQWCFEYSDASLFRDAVGVSVLQDVFTGSDGHLHSSGSWVTIGDLMAVMPLHACNAGEPKPAASSSSSNEITLEPWLHHAALWSFMRDKDLVSSDGKLIEDTGKEACIEASSGSHDGDSGSDLDVWEALADRRAELDEHVVGELDPFVLSLRGGQWCADHVGVAFDSYRATARVGDPTLFSTIHKLPKTATFSIAKYSEHDCLIMCQFWIHRMRFLYDIWKGAGAEAEYKFSVADVREYRPPAEVQALLEGPASASKTRALGISDLLPA